MHIGIAGNIGSGKTTLTGMLAEHYGWTPKYEAVSYNPYLEDYYKDIARWSFNLEVYFLEQRFKILLKQILFLACRLWARYISTFTNNAIYLAHKFL